MSLATSSISVALDGRTVQAEVVRSPRARTTRIQVGRDRPLRVVVPAGASDEFARESVLAKEQWVLRKLREMAEAEAKPLVLGLNQAGVVWRHGRSMPVISAATGFAEERDGALLVPAGAAAAAAVLRWYRRRARTFLRGLVADEANRLGVSPASVVIRDQRTRWGSCSSRGTISLNWRLYLVPEAVARYVVVHELVHLQIPNHSKAFWRAVSAVAPQWQDSARWLREHGDELRRYEPVAMPLG